MQKRKNRKTIQLPKTVEAQIRTRARNLTIGSCYISNGWKEMSEGNVLVSRLHSNGNLTFAFFLVDLAAMGIKDVLYDFNIAESEFSELLARINLDASMIEIEYNIAHNIIYGALEYADEIGFLPHKGFSVGKYVLEEDNENIPLIDIEFGIDGMPAIFCSSKEPRNKEISQLTERVGKSNFSIFYDDGLEDDDELQEVELMQGWEDDIDSLGVPEWDDDQWITYFDQDPKQYSFRIIQYFTDMIFLEKNDINIDAFEMVLGDALYDYTIDDGLSLTEREIIDELVEAVDSYKQLELLKMIKDTALEHPDLLEVNLFYLSYIADLLPMNECIIEFDKYKSKNPDNLQLLEFYSLFLVKNEMEAKIPNLFRNNRSLGEFSNKRSYSSADIINFCKSYCYYFMYLDDLVSLEPYYHVLDTLEDGDPGARMLIQEITLRKMDVINNLSSI